MSYKFWYVKIVKIEKKFLYKYLRCLSIKQFLNSGKKLYFLHCFKNLGKIFFKIIEVQSGEYLEEDEIIRFEDNWKKQARSFKNGRKNSKRKI